MARIDLCDLSFPEIIRQIRRGANRLYFASTPFDVVRQYDPDKPQKPACYEVYVASDRIGVVYGAGQVLALFERFCNE